MPTGASQLDLFSTGARPLAARPLPLPAAAQPRALELTPTPPPPPPVARKLEMPEPPPVSPALPVPSRQQTLVKARQLAERIAVFLGSDLKVHLTVHDNRSTMISFRRQLPLVRIRAHHMFLEAPDAVVKSIADYAGRGHAKAGAVLDTFIAEQQALIRAYPRKPTALEPRGKCFDLQVLFEGINAAHFDGKIDARIGWGRLPGKRRRKSIRLGVYDHKAREIRIHPALDRPDVPRFFVEFIVFHEMLHQLFPSARDTGRNVHHPRAFRDRERAWPHYGAALTWEKEHLQELLRR